VGMVGASKRFMVCNVYYQLTSFDSNPSSQARAGSCTFSQLKRCASPVVVRSRDTSYTLPGRHARLTLPQRNMDASN
jgi:hypothetical protein